MNLNQAVELLTDHIEWEIESDLLPEKDDEEIDELEKAIQIIRDHITDVGNMVESEGVQ